MKTRKALVEKQIQWILSYVQGESADIWKENLLEDFELGEVEFGLAREFLLELRKLFKGENKELVKVAELKRM